MLVPVWRRKPKSRVLVHSDQGTQSMSLEWASFLKHHNLGPSTSRRGNCHDNAFAESCFNLLKGEQIRHKVDRTRDEARPDLFDDIEMFYYLTRKHARNGMLSPVEFELKHKSQTEGVWKTRCGSPPWRAVPLPQRDRRPRRCPTVRTTRHCQYMD